MIARRAIAVTGASGFIGRAVLQRGADAGQHMMAWVRRPIAFAGPQTFYDLASPPPEGTAGMTIIHLAYDPGQTLTVEQEADALRALAGIRGVRRVVFVSSQTALSPNSEYGRRKAYLEGVARELGCDIIRPALVAGPGPDGAFGKLARLARLAPLRLAPFPSVRMQLVHVDDVADALLAAALEDGPPREANIAGVPLALQDVTRCIRRHRFGLSAGLAMPAPRAAIRLASRCIVGSAGEQVRSMLASIPMENTAGPGPVLRPPAEAVAGRRNVARKRLLREGYSLLRVTSGRRPPAILARRYVHALTAWGVRTAVARSRSGAMSAWTVALCGRADGPPYGLPWRLDVAARIAEFSHRSGDAFRLQADESTPAAWAGVLSDAVRAVAEEIVARAIGAPLRGLLLERPAFWAPIR